MNPRSMKSHESQQFASLSKGRSVESLAQIRKANISSSLPVQWNRHRKLFLGIYAVTTKVTRRRQTTFDFKTRPIRRSG
ncbi:MAG: hypothetical protein ACK493_12965 [Planctomycetota bacterium]